MLSGAAGAEPSGTECSGGPPIMLRKIAQVSTKSLHLVGDDGAFKTSHVAKRGVTSRRMFVQLAMQTAVTVTRPSNRHQFFGLQCHPLYSRTTEPSLNRNWFNT